MPIRPKQTSCAIGLALALGSAACSGGLDVEMTPLTVVGRVVNSSGNVADAEVRGGGYNQIYNWEPSQTVTDDKGRFAVEFPTSAESASLNFVEVTIPVPAPDGSGIIETHMRVPVELGEANQTIEVANPAPCSATVAEVIADTELCGNLLLPDLKPMLSGLNNPPDYPLPEDSWYIDTTTREGSTLLRLASATANIGDGMLHMIPSTSPSDDAVGTWQRIWTDADQYIDRQAGTFVYHPTHRHFHLDEFEQYRLLSLEGDEVALGEKVSFCLIDVLSAEEQAHIGFGVFLAAVCQDADEQQVLNPGWADYYGASLEDQWIDITGVAPGDYLVEMIVDPENVLLESDETNNTARFPITLTESDLKAS